MFPPSIYFYDWLSLKTGTPQVKFTHFCHIRTKILPNVMAIMKLVIIITQRGEIFMDYNNNYHQNDNENMNDDNQEYTERETNGGIAQSARQNTKPNQSEKPKLKKSGNFLSGIAGCLISAIIVVLLFTTNIIPNNDSSTSSETGSSDNNQSSQTPEVTETIASDNTDVASSMDEASKAVVGVTRMQQTNIWEPSQKSGTGSGIVYKKENGSAYVVTNHHVVEDAQEVEVVLNDQEHIKAEVLGSDKLSDLAVLKVDGSKIDTVANLGSSSDLKVGES